MKLAIVGSRSFNDYIKLCEHFSGDGITEIVSGGAKGADFLAEQFAYDHNLPLKLFLPEWEKFGKKAGHMRNQLIVDYCDMLIAFWDGKSPGTKNSISLIKKSGKPYKVVLV